MLGFTQIKQFHYFTTEDTRIAKKRYKISLIFEAFVFCTVKNKFFVIPNVIDRERKESCKDQL
jgi:hypothetical protein